MLCKLLNVLRTTFDHTPTLVYQKSQTTKVKTTEVHCFRELYYLCSARKF